MKEQFAAHGIRLSLELEEALPTVRANPVQLEQVIINLAVNAMHALDELERPDKHVAIVACRQGDRVVVSVRDNGPGFEGAGERIFDPFFTHQGDRGRHGAGFVYSPFPGDAMERGRPGRERGGRRGRVHPVLVSGLGRELYFVNRRVQVSTKVILYRIVIPGQSVFSRLGALGVSEPPR